MKHMLGLNAIRDNSRLVVRVGLKNLDTKFKDVHLNMERLNEIPTTKYEILGFDYIFNGVKLVVDDTNNTIKTMNKYDEPASADKLEDSILGKFPNVWMASFYYIEDYNTDDEESLIEILNTDNTLYKYPRLKTWFTNTPSKIEKKYEKVVAKLKSSGRKKAASPPAVAKGKRCPKGTHKNKKTGLCEADDVPQVPAPPSPPVIAPPVPVPPSPPVLSSVKGKRCPKGTRRNKKTGLCEGDIAPPPQPIPIVEPSQPKPASVKLKRCPKGQTRNKKTGNCEPK